jgi:hypothetical protein
MDDRSLEERTPAVHERRPSDRHPTDLHLRGLYRARIGDWVPIVGVQEGIVTIRYPRVASCDWTGRKQ